MFCPDCGTWNRGGAASCARCAAHLPAVPGDPEKPDQELGRLRRATGARYRVLRRLGAGGMADVYLAELTELGRPVAIKVLHAHLARDPEIVERFRREAQAAAQLAHPHICPIVDIGTVEGLLFTVMPYFAGGSLADRLDRDRVLDARRTAAVITQIACALDYAHRHGVIHRDVKPDNVLFDEDGNAVLTDFGIATARFHSRLTMTGRAMGTPHYMSPEQAMGKLVDGRSDLYSLGVVMYQALAGVPPFDGADSFSISYKQVHENPVPLSQIAADTPEALTRVAMRCLAKSPADRFARGHEVADALVGFLAPLPDAATALRLATTARNAQISMSR